MKGQVTVEYLLLFSLALVLIAFAIGALAVIKDTEDQLTSLKQAEIAVASLKSAGDSACALGSGNSRIVELEWEIGLECSGNEVSAIVNGQSAFAALEHCEFSSCESGGSFRVVNNEFGEIEIGEK